jgi:mono/diheme cytochrome c family protein
MNHIRSQPLPLIGPLSVMQIVTRLGALLSLLWLALLFLQSWQGTYPAAPVELTLRAHLPENGGWLSDDPLQVVSGQPVRLTVEAVEGVHALHIAHTDITSTVVAPGTTQALEFTAPAPGRYVIYCKLWCGRDHWRMRTVLEVIDPEAPHTPLRYIQDEPRYDLSADELNIDSPHPAAVWPQIAADVAEGETRWQVLSGDADPGAFLTELGWPLVSPSTVYESLARGEHLPDADSIDANDRWALVAFLWEMKSTPETLARGQAIYVESCASCHGADGSGNGFAASESIEVEPDLRQASTAAGASPAQYYAKIARGGMGTGMPNWGNILSEDDLWAVTEYLYTFLFNDPMVETAETDASAFSDHH